MRKEVLVIILLLIIVDDINYLMNESANMFSCCNIDEIQYQQLGFNSLDKLMVLAQPTNKGDGVRIRALEWFR